MRISETKVVQFIESSPPRLVLLDDETGAEIVLDRAEVGALVRAVEYFTPAMLAAVGRS